MEPYNFGLFAGFNLEKERCLLNLAIALEYWLAGGRDDESKEMEKLTQVQERTISNLAQTMSQSSLLRELLTPLLQAPRTGRSNELLAAGKDLIDYAIPGIEQKGTSAYNDAVIAWQNRWPMPPRLNHLRNYAALMQKNTVKLVYGKRGREDTRQVFKMNSAAHDEQGGTNKRKRTSLAKSMAVNDNDYLSPTTSNGSLISSLKFAGSQQLDMEARRAKDMRKKESLAQASTEANKAYYTTTNTKHYPLLQPRIRSQDQIPQSPTPESEESRFQKEFRRKRRIDIITSYDKSSSMLPSGWVPGRIKFGPAGLDYEDGYDTPLVVESLEPRVIRNAIPPRKTPGDKAVHDGTLDFENAVVGERDESKLFIEYSTTRRDPQNPNSTIRGDRVQKRYPELVDFDDAKSVNKLNAWRGQIFRRNFPETCRKKFNHPWLQTEIDTVLELVRAQMTTHKRLTWVSLANSYNLKIAGQFQKAGEKLAKGGKRKAHILKEDRQAPLRTGASIQGTLTKLQEYRELMKELLPTVDKDGNEADPEDLTETEENEEEIAESGSDLGS